VSIPQSVILKTVLQPVGVIKYEDELKVVFHLIVPDEPEEPITFKSNGGNQLVVEKIENVQNFTNPSLWTKMILPTLKIVGGNDSESKIVGNKGCSRCDITKKILINNGIEFDYETLSDLSEQEQKKTLSEAKEEGIVALPIIICDGKYITNVQEVIDICK
jgi:glutaredoxin